MKPIVITLFIMLAIPAAATETDLGPILAACHDVTKRAPAVAEMATARHLGLLSREDLAQVAPMIVIGGIPLGQDKPLPNPPKVGLKSDVLRGWWVDRKRNISLIYQEATQPRGGPGLSPYTAMRWRSCQVGGRINDASALLAAALSLEKEPEPFVNPKGQLVIWISAPFKYSQARSVPDLPSELVLTFDKPMKFSGDFLASRSRAKFLKAAAHSGAFKFESETNRSIP